MNHKKIIEEIFGQFDDVSFSVRLWTGEVYNFGGDTKDHFVLNIENKKAFKRLISEGSIGFGESYMDGSIKIGGDLEAYLSLRYKLKRTKYSLGLIMSSLIAKATTPFFRRKQISYHYDLGNDFFSLILDNKTMSYSAGRYQDGSESLDSAQQNKIDLVCDWIGLSKGATVLDLGAGWGGFSNYGALKYGWKINGFSLSNAQLNFCRDLVRKNKIEELVTYEYRDMINDLPTRKYDAVVMIESIEHVGKKRLESFFKEVVENLKQGGVMYVQTTGRYEHRDVDRWTLKYVFPGGYLPTKDEIIQYSKNAGLILEDFRDDTPDYVKTMSEWIKNLEVNKVQITQMFGTSFYRLWELWMHGAKVAFENESMSLFRFKFRLPK